MADAPIRKSAAPPHATITRDFGDGSYVLGLTWSGMVELEEARGTPLLALLSRLANGTWHVKDSPEVIRLGLIGGGLEPAKALNLVRTYVEARPPGESWPLAVEILSLALFGETKAPAANGDAKIEAKMEPGA
jgi:hypothetical protein